MVLEKTLESPLDCKEIQPVHSEGDQPWVFFSWEIDGETVETVSDFIFWAPKSLQMVIAALKLKDTYSLEGKL